MAETVAVKNAGITSSGLKCTGELLKKSDIPVEGHAASKSSLSLRGGLFLYYASDYHFGPPTCCKSFLKIFEMFILPKFKLACPPNSSVFFDT